MRAAAHTRARISTIAEWTDRGRVFLARGGRSSSRPDLQPPSRSRAPAGGRTVRRSTETANVAARSTRRPCVLAACGVCGRASLRARPSHSLALVRSSRTCSRRCHRPNLRAGRPAPDEEHQRKRDAHESCASHLVPAAMGGSVPPCRRAVLRTTQRHGGFVSTSSRGQSRCSVGRRRNTSHVPRSGAVKPAGRRRA